jgi:hypothetical protein
LRLPCLCKQRGSKNRIRILLPVEDYKGGTSFPYWGFYILDKFWEQMREIENSKADAEARERCTLCGFSTRGAERKPNGLCWVQGWVHKECVEAMEEGFEGYQATHLRQVLTDDTCWGGLPRCE